MPPSNPQIRDRAAWIQMLQENRRILLERLLAEFPDILRTQRFKVDEWRAKLSTTDRL